MTNDGRRMFPVCMNLLGRLAVIVGGGAVGQRKARAVLAGGGRVRLICLESRPAGSVGADVDWRTAPYEDAQLEDAFLVFAAATPEVNRQVVRDARARGLLLNVADDAAASDFLTPTTVRRGAVTLAVSTGGAAQPWRGKSGSCSNNNSMIPLPPGPKRWRSCVP